MVSSMSTGVHVVGQGVTIEGAEFWILRQTDFQIACIAVLLIRECDWDEQGDNGFSGTLMGLKQL